jgi:DNA polymerase III delta subunit
MSDSGFFAFLTRIAGGKELPHIIVLYGFNEFLGEKILGSLSRGMLEEKSEFNYKRYYFDEDENHWEEVITEARSSSFFFSSRKILIAVIRDEKRLTVRPVEKQIILQYLQNPNPHTSLVVFVSLDLSRDDYKQVRKTKLAGFLKALDSENTVMIDLDKTGEADIKEYIKQYLKERKITITSSAIDRMLEIRGDDFISVLHQLPKLEVAAAQSNSLDTEDIDEMITGISSHSIWDLTEAIEQEDAPRYLNILKYLFINGIKPSFIIGTLIAHYHKIYMAKYLLQRHFSFQDIGRVLQQPVFILNKFIVLVKGFSDFKIREVLRLIYKLDLESKTGGEDGARVSLQNFIFRVRLIRENDDRGEQA